jgi:hypothetical protein
MFNFKFHANAGTAIRHYYAIFRKNGRIYFFQLSNGFFPFIFIWKKNGAPLQRGTNMLPPFYQVTLRK